jgi:hypothetical protein
MLDTASSGVVFDIHNISGAQTVSIIRIIEGEGGVGPTLLVKVR